MLKVMETFSGIGAQAKALEKLNIDYEIIATADWDVNAIIAYDLIHNGKQDLNEYIKLTKEDLVSRLSKYTLSPDGKKPYEKKSLNRIDVKILQRLLCAIERCNNLVSITDIKGVELEDDIDLFTYSFPCQDLSLASVWHGNMSGIDRGANNRSGMLWEVERILKECVQANKNVPKFLLMENVKNILSPRHRGNFQEWIDYLSGIGYYNKIYCLNACDFGIPQNRERVYMLSVYFGGDLKKYNTLKEYFEKKDLDNDEYVKSLNIDKKDVCDILRTDYSIKKYKNEADRSQLNDTPSRWKIVQENDTIYDGDKFLPILKTITTKQDRNPNSGIIKYDNELEGKINYRYLTPRECFLAMGFDEEDYDILIKNDLVINKRRNLFSDSKLIKMAGNSIVVNVLEAIFMQIVEIKELLL